MNNLIPLEDQISYSEILFLLSTMDESYTKRLPEDLMDFFKKASDENYEVKIDDSLPRYTDNFKSYTVDIFNVLNLNFWCKDEEERKNTITFLLDKPTEFKLNKQMEVLKGESGNFFEEILEENKKKENVIEQFKKEFSEVKKERENKIKDTNDEKNINKGEKKKNFLENIKNIFKK